MNITKDKPLPGQNDSCFHVLIGDEAFGLGPFVYVQSRLNPHMGN